MMERKTISENFQAMFGDGCRVKAAVFTTYNFEPDFFEQEVIPLMLDRDLAFSSDARIKSIQVREALADAGLPIEVFYDRDIYREQATQSPAMEYMHHGVRGERSAFHAKLIFLLIEDPEEEETFLYVGAGSANLTGAGWWENLECQHWELVESGGVRKRFLNQLRGDLAWLRKRRSPVTGNSTTALDLIGEYLDSCTASNSARIVSYYGLEHAAKRTIPSFVKFLKSAQKEQHPHYQRWSLEIISPYFAESTDFEGHGFFFNELGVHEIRIFLPMNAQKQALCTEEYFEEIMAADNVEWAEWRSDHRKALEIDARKIHAKIYHFYNGQQSWAFIGSVNFTHRAFSDNQEAGFFVKLPSRAPMLTPLKALPDGMCSEDELSIGMEKNASDAALPDLALCYDWKQRQLTAVAGDGDRLRVNVLSAEGEICIEKVVVGPEPDVVSCDVEIIESLLRNSGFLSVTGTWLPKGPLFDPHVVLVQQINWTHKPLDLPPMSPQEILQIYAGLSALRRNQIIEILKGRALLAEGLASEMVQHAGNEESGRQFFAEYAELFHAFRELRRRLEDAAEKNHLSQVDYYLSGRGMDSLPTLIDSLEKESAKLDPVTVYLTLLSLCQLYAHPLFKDRPQVETHAASCQAKITEIEQSQALTLITGRTKDRATFFDWYREQFFREYRAVEEVATSEAD